MTWVSWQRAGISGEQRSTSTPNTPASPGGAQRIPGPAMGGSASSTRSGRPRNRSGGSMNSWFGEPNETPNFAQKLQTFVIPDGCPADAGRRSGTQTRHGGNIRARRGKDRCLGWHTSGVWVPDLRPDRFASGHPSGMTRRGDIWVEEKALRGPQLALKPMPRPGQSGVEPSSGMPAKRRLRRP